MPQELINILLTAAGALVTALVTWLSSLLISWLNSKLKDKKLASWLAQITEIITTAINCTNQTYVEALKDTNVFDKEAQEKALTKTLENVKSQLSKDAIKFIEDNFGDVENWLITQIESLIYKKKEEK